MKIADLCIHQPSYWPWLGLLDKIAKSRDFILLDNAQVSKGTYQYRNIFYCEGKAKHLTLPTRIHLGDTFNDLTFNNTNGAINHFDVLKNYYRKARYHDEIMEVIEPLYSVSYIKPIDLLIATMRASMTILEIDSAFYLASSYLVEGKKGDMVLNLCKQHGASSYLAGQGSKNYMAAYLDKFHNNGLEVLWHQFQHPIYQQNPNEDFVVGLSCLDILFFNGIERSRQIFWDNVAKQVV